ncbi:uncharacterized protein LOC113122633 isoform X2 [Mastacembelus armatus]|uniref:uncharacterized protein LOC113122633 isoform X2 n=1 Tax=Mastacembelus armatus TaxID=205130 RepID=UPI000E455623|nr:uncharacterized protein LOC113122633 isoform X2 [Mastacembelus armatus]
MKTIMSCILILPFALMVVTAAVRARRENVLSFLTGALGTTTEKTVTANTTGYGNPPRKVVTEKDSEDVSDAKSTESFETDRLTVKDVESHEILTPKVVQNDETPFTGASKDKVVLLDVSRRLVQEHGSRERSGPCGSHQASKEQTDLDSEEGMTVDAQEVETVSGKQVMCLDGARMTGEDSQGPTLQRKAGRVEGMKGTVVSGESRDLLDQDSLEDNNSNIRTESREYISSETSPIERVPSGLSVPAKNPAS